MGGGGNSEDAMMITNDFSPPAGLPAAGGRRFIWGISSGGARTADRSAFSLLELLTVMAVLGIAAALIAPAAANFGRAQALRNAGNLVADLAAAARQQAMARSTLTALVLLANQGTPNDYRALAIAEYDATGRVWQQTSRWEILPTGVMVDRNDAFASSFLQNSPQPLPFAAAGSVPITFQGAAIAFPGGYAARVFTPRGALSNPDFPAQIRLVEAVTSGSSLVYTRPGASGKPVNFYDVSIVPTTGLTKINQP
jgi:prepilin-type N-terminal cleavage/methylation domain-containing protein